ncbi:hybrid sensor histidine kinase/response regulator [Flavobacterium sp.]|uniref:hybrid sensor histidine kinase/response regulator n=1 Tax=Flavobacterium sp. TaxID=239 RepID=UPI00261D1F2B|nr:hybrid sensor histidine kinase/response regulator [Flavobacterium sp.]
MTRPLYKYCFLLFFLLFFNLNYAQYVFKEPIPSTISLHEHTTIADVGQQEFDIAFIQANYAKLRPWKLKTENDDLGFTDHHFWAKLQLENAVSKPLHYYLETARPITDLVEMYAIDATGTIKKSISGDQLKFSQRSFQDRKTIFRIDLEPQDKVTLYFHLKSDGEVIKMPMMLRSSESFIEAAAKEQLFLGVFYGILITAAIIYLFFFFGLREKTFLYYSLYVVFIGLMQFALDGYFYQIVTPNSGWFSLHAVLLFAMTAGILLGKYSEVFLKIKERNRLIYILFNVLYALAFVVILTIVFIPSLFAVCYPLANVLGLLILILIITSVINLYYHGKHIDHFFSVGILFLILGFGIFILNNFGQVPNSFFTQNSSKFGTGLEIIFLSLSMGNLIRDLKNEKEELNQLALIRLGEMNDLKSYFLSNISHELRTPLNAILNLTDAISKEVADEKLKQNCQIIKYSSHSLLSSVNDILDFSKIEKGELQLERVQFEPVKVLEHLKNNAANRAKDQGLEFEFSKADGIPEHMMGDVTRLVQVVNNVLSNAIKFTAQGSVKFHIDAQPKPNNRSSLILTISDTGVGIPKDKMNSIFDSFSQNSIDNKRKFGGLGLGLYIVKTLVDMQNGTIQLDSVENIGTTCKIMIDFEVFIPEKKEAPIADTTVFDLQGKSILVVEDNAINQMVIKMITKKWLNTSVVYANNGQEGLDALQQQHFDIILMDLQMPVMDGYEATIAIRNGEAGEANKNIPIIAVTADVMETTKIRVKEIGMNYYISKPLKNETLFQAIMEMF